MEDSFEKIIFIHGSDEKYVFSLKYEWQLEKVEETEFQEIFHIKKNIFEDEILFYYKFQGQPPCFRDMNVKRSNLLIIQNSLVSIKSYYIVIIILTVIWRVNQNRDNEHFQSTF